MNKQEFLEELKKLGINLTNDQIDKLARFYQLLVTWNEKINLTTIIKEEEVYLKHFYDSLTLIKVIDLRQPLTILDVGTGAGFPGIVLKIVFPNLKITLLDSLTKRINYLNEIIKELDLHDIETVCSRCEEYTKINREKYDLVVARAVSHLKILSEMIIPTVKVNGYFIAMKANLNDELEKTIPMLKKLNSELKEIKEFSLPIENSKRTLVVMKKNAKTALLYPRKYSEIKKMK